MMEITKENIEKYAAKYDERFRGKEEEVAEKEIKEWFTNYRYLDKDAFVKLGRWKTKRQTKNYKSNDAEYVKAVTQKALQAEDEEIKIKSLMALHGGLKGVSWAVASVVLHFAFPDKYPILDFRALWSLGWQKPKNYDFEFWQKYCEKIREISRTTSKNLRTIDKALWEYSKDP